MRFANKVVLIIVALAFFTIGPAHAGMNVKIGVVDFQKALKLCKAGQEFQKKIETKGRKMEAELKKKSKEIDDLAEQIDRGASVMDPDKLDEKKRELEIKKYDYQNLSKKYQKKLREMQSDMLSKIQDDMIGIVDKIGKEGGYTLILDKNAAVYYPGGIDITDEMIKKYDASFDGNLE